MHILTQSRKAAKVLCEVGASELGLLVRQGLPVVEFLCGSAALRAIFRSS